MGNVLITGGTSGIGYALARVFAINNYNVFVVSSNYDRLKATQQSLGDELSVSIKIYEKDLSKLGTAEELYSKLQSDNIDIDILINNAGYGLIGRTEEIDFEKDERMMVLNMISLVELCKLVLPYMYNRQHGKILNISSTGAFQPGPFTSTYFASKAFVLSYSKAIRYEAKSKGVQVCTLCPGATKTNFFINEGTQTPNNAMSAEKVANYAYKQIMNNKSVSIPGCINRILQVFPTYIKMISVANMKKRHGGLFPCRRK